MENKVGSEIPSEKQIKSWQDRIQALADEIEPYTVKLSADDAKHLLRFRPGGEVIVALVADLAVKYGISLPDMPVQGMRDDLTLAQRLAPVASSVGLVAERLTNTLGQARSETWQAATGNYSVLVRVSVANPSLEKELEPARAFFARRTKPQGPTGGDGGGSGGVK
jgi:hypothetical protein